MKRRWIRRGATLLLLTGLAAPASAGVFLDATESQPQRVTHPAGYLGSGGTLNVSVCIEPGSPNLAAMERSIENAIATYNALEVHTRNLPSGINNNIPIGQIDFESVALHELGHCVGLAHSNLASESGLVDPQADSTKTGTGPGGSYTTDFGADGIPGSKDDLRGNDVNWFWFEKGVNDPFWTTTSTIDATTFSRNLADLPGGHSFAASGHRTVTTVLPHVWSESVMNQGTYVDEAQRLLTADDVAMLSFAMSGRDETAGTSDDYTLALSHLPGTGSCDVVFEFDDTKTGFASCIVTTQSIPASSTHFRITSARVYFNDSWAWFFNDESCGNGILEVTEPCDDGGTLDGDGCDQSCVVESGFECGGEPSICLPPGSNPVPAAGAPALSVIALCIGGTGIALLALHRRHS